jgi:hypothetical protein
MNDKLKYKIFDALQSLLSDAMEHTINGISFIISGTPIGYEEKEKLIESKINSMQRLSDNYEMGLINDYDAKKEFMRIMHGPQNTGGTQDG